MSNTNRPKLPDLSRGVQAALKMDPDYSQAFTKRVALLARSISDALSIQVEHDPDMNYSAAQKIVIWLNAHYQPVPPRSPDAVYRLNMYVSSKGRYFTFVTLVLSTAGENGQERRLDLPEQYWVRLDEDSLPAAIQMLQQQIASVMQSQGYTFVNEPLLSQEAEGYTTEMDSRPATVFDVLFSEVY
jgi:hypothetical protein